MTDPKVLDLESLPDAFDAVEPEKLAELASELRDARRRAVREHAPSTWAQDVDPLVRNDLDWPTKPDGEYAYKFDLAPAEETVVTEICQTIGADRVGHGVARVGVRPHEWDGFILKFGRWGPDILSMSGRHQNLFEAHVYEEHRDLSPPLLPVVAIASNGAWLVQPEVVTLRERPAQGKSVDASWHPVRRRMWWQTMALHDLVFFEGFLAHNIGYWRDEWYVFDYARPRKRDAYHWLD